MSKISLKMVEEMQYPWKYGQRFHPDSIYRANNRVHCEEPSDHPVYPYPKRIAYDMALWTTDLFRPLHLKLKINPGRLYFYGINITEDNQRLGRSRNVSIRNTSICLSWTRYTKSFENIPIILPTRHAPHNKTLLGACLWSYPVGGIWGGLDLHMAK